jgi:hypothetical protein
MSKRCCLSRQREGILYEGPLSVRLVNIDFAIHDIICAGLLSKGLEEILVCPNRDSSKLTCQSLTLRSSSQQYGDDFINVHVQPDYTATYCDYSGYSRSICWNERAADYYGVWLQAHNPSA